MTTTFNLLNHAMLNQVLHELRHGRLQRCKALGLTDEDIECFSRCRPPPSPTWRTRQLPGSR